MIIKKYIAYLGVETPKSKDQIAVEISGLKHAVKVAEELISRLEQSLAIARLQVVENAEEPRNDKNRSKNEGESEKDGSKVKEEG